MNAAVLPINPNESELISHVKSQESFNSFHTENNISLFFFVILVQFYFPAWWIILLYNRKHKPYILYMYLFSPPPIKCVSCSFQMVLVAIFSETGFFDYCAVKVSRSLKHLETWRMMVQPLFTYSNLQTLIHQNNNGAGGSLSFKVSCVRQEQLRPEAFFIVTLKTQTLSCLVGKKSRIWELQASFKKKKKHHRRRTSTMLCTSAAFLYCPDLLFPNIFQTHVKLSCWIWKMFHLAGFLSVAGTVLAAMRRWDLHLQSQVSFSLIKCLLCSSGL